MRRHRDHKQYHPLFGPLCPGDWLQTHSLQHKPLDQLWIRHYYSSLFLPLEQLVTPNKLVPQSLFLYFCQLVSTNCSSLSEASEVYAFWDCFWSKRFADPKDLSRQQPPTHQGNIRKQCQCDYAPPIAIPSGLHRFWADYDTLLDDSECDMRSHMGRVPAAPEDSHPRNIDPRHWP